MHVIFLSCSFRSGSSSFTAFLRTNRSRYLVVAALAIGLAANGRFTALFSDNSDGLRGSGLQFPKPGIQSFVDTSGCKSPHLPNSAIQHAKQMASHFHPDRSGAITSAIGSETSYTQNLRLLFNSDHSDGWPPILVGCRLETGRTGLFNHWHSVSRIRIILPIKTSL